MSRHDILDDSGQIKKVCGNCKYVYLWVGEAKCRRHAPIIVQTQYIGKTEKQYPEVDAYNHWCGDYTFGVWATEEEQ